MEGKVMSSGSGREERDKDDDVTEDVWREA